MALLKLRVHQRLFFCAVAFPVLALLLIVAHMKLKCEIPTTIGLSGIHQDPKAVSSHLTIKNDNILTSFKQILIWNTPNTVQKYAFGLGYEPFLTHNCRYKHCILLTNASLVNSMEIDAVLFNIPELWLSRNLPNFQRQPHQRFIFFALESPVYSSISSYNFTTYFNWTMTYRPDSDFTLPYGRVIPKVRTTRTGRVSRSSIGNRATDYAFNKTKLVAWFVSHCNTDGKRENYVKELQKHIPVDIYGSCGNMSCRKDGIGWLSTHECYHMLEGTYKFYLSFENSICTEYVTEKFFSALQHQIVPVVYGGANYSEIAPEHSYIDANLLSPKELATLLITLDKNDSLYNEYFWWKNYYDVVAEVDVLSGEAFCKLCEELHTNFDTKIYDNIATTWNRDAQCSKPRQTF